MRKEILLPALAVLAGGVGFGLRRWELSTAFEETTGLAVANAPATWALILCSLVVGVILLILCRGGREFPDGYDEAFPWKSSVPAAAVLTLGGLFALAGGISAAIGLPARWEAALMQAYQLQSGNPKTSAMTALIPHVLTLVLSLLSCAGVLALAWGGRRSGSKGSGRAWTLAPAFAACLWLIGSYQAHSGDPVRLNYLYEVLAVTAALLGSYYIAGFSFGKGKCGPAAFFCLGGTYLSLVTLADLHEISDLLLYGFFGIYLTAHAYLLLRSCREKPRMCPSQTAEEETTLREDTTHE